MPEGRSLRLEAVRCGVVYFDVRAYLQYTEMVGEVAARYIVHVAVRAPL